jgi:flagellar motility protein MotE (MotC chaperone)
MDIEVKEKQSGKGRSFLWFLYVVVIPLLFAITVAIIVGIVSGVNVIDAAKDFGQKIPLVGSLLQKNDLNTSKMSEKNIIDLQGQIKDREEEISQLQTELENKGKDIQRAELENNRLQKEIDDMSANETDRTRALKDMIKTYETMSPKKAAPIIVKMNDNEALKILSSIKADILAAIMEKMNPQDAAKYTQLLTNDAEINN